MADRCITELITRRRDAVVSNFKQLLEQIRLSGIQCSNISEDVCFIDNDLDIHCIALSFRYTITMSVSDVSMLRQVLILSNYVPRDNETYAGETSNVDICQDGTIEFYSYIEVSLSELIGAVVLSSIRDSIDKAIAA